MPTVAFRNIPQNLRVPLFYAEVDNSRANTAQAVQRALILGQITSDGTGTANVPVISQGVADAKTIGGKSSMLAFMTEAYRANDAFGELWYLPLADDGSAVAATGTIQITHVATTSGTWSLYIAGIRLSLPVTTAQTVDQIAAALSALINADSPVLPVTASVSTSTVTLTADNKGPAGNDISINSAYLGTAGGDTVPAGLTFTITAMASGATAPTLTTALANLGDQSFDFIVCPYTDSTSLDALKTFLSDTTGRWSWAQQVYGHVWAQKAGSLGTLTTLGAARNNQHESIMGANGSPTPSWIWAAARCGAAAASLRADPGLPLQTVVVQGVLAPPLTSRFILTDRNTLLFNGISTFTVDDDGTVRIENEITTYQKNAFGAADNSYLQVEEMFLLMFGLRALKSVVTSKYARVKLADNGTRSPGSTTVTPNIIRGDLIAQYGELVDGGIFDNFDRFKAEVVVERDASNPNRVNVLYPATLIAGLRIFALLMQFRLI